MDQWGVLIDEVMSNKVLSSGDYNSIRNLIVAK